MGEEEHFRLLELIEINEKRCSHDKPCDRKARRFRLATMIAIKENRFQKIPIRMERQSGAIGGMNWPHALARKLVGVVGLLKSVQHMLILFVVSSVHCTNMNSDVSHARRIQMQMQHLYLCIKCFAFNCVLTWNLDV